MGTGLGRQRAAWLPGTVKHSSSSAGHLPFCCILMLKLVFPAHPLINQSMISLGARGAWGCQHSWYKGAPWAVFEVTHSYQAGKHRWCMTLDFLSFSPGNLEPGWFISMPPNKPQDNGPPGKEDSLRLWMLAVKGGYPEAGTRHWGFSEADILLLLWAVNSKSLKAATLSDTYKSHKPPRSVNFIFKRGKNQRQKKAQRGRLR